MKVMKATKALMFATALMLVQTKAQALTDSEALDLGMMPIEEFLVSEMKSVVTPGLNAEGVERAVRSHRLVIAINKAAKGPDAQTMKVFENGVEILSQKISTGKETRVTSTSGKTYVSTTPKGYFRPTKMYTDYLSYTWNAPMPNAVFFVGGIAIHATTAVNALGTRASGGCVRTRLETSKFIREKVMETGMGSQPGQYKLVTEGKGRKRVSNNSVMVDKINRNNGDILGGKVLSWDTVIVVYE